MKNNESQEFVDLLTVTLSVYGASVTAPAVSIWFAALRRYSLTDVKRALSEHAQNPGAGKFAPKPADIIGFLQDQDGRPGAEESWARLSRAIGDEGATVVLTSEERAAFFVADAIADDKIAARMAFKEAYTHAVHAARAAGHPVEWGFILGHYPAERETALIEAVEQGKITAERVVPLLPYRDDTDPRVKALLESTVERRRLS